MLPYKKVWSSHFISFSFSTQHQTIRLELGWAGPAASVLMYQVSLPIMSHLQSELHHISLHCSLSKNEPLLSTLFIHLGKSVSLILAENSHS